ncbi:MAG: VWA domain-containing protein [Frankia sp.]
MRFLAGHWLWLLFAIAGLLIGYGVATRRRALYSARLPTSPVLATVLSARASRWRHRIPAAVFALTLVALVFALARPVEARQTPRDRGTVMLAIDVSNSMASTDVAPTRLESAKLGATAFVGKLPARINLGLVAFAGTAAVLVPPTTDRVAVLRAIHNLRLGPATAIGDGIFAALQAIRAFSFATGPTGPTSERRAGPGGAIVPPPPPPAVIVLLSDGETTAGRSNETAAAAAVAARTPVDTIAYGTPGGTLEVDGQALPVPVNAQALRDIARTTHGAYYRATSRGELHDAYRQLGTSIGYRTTYQELTTWFLGLAVVGGLLTAALSIAWAPRLP